MSRFSLDEAIAIVLEGEDERPTAAEWNATWNAYLTMIPFGEVQYEARYAEAEAYLKMNTYRLAQAELQRRADLVEGFGPAPDDNVKQA